MSLFWTHLDKKRMKYWRARYIQGPAMGLLSVSVALVWNNIWQLSDSDDKSHKQMHSSAENNAEAAAGRQWHKTDCHERPIAWVGHRHNTTCTFGTAVSISCKSDV